VHAWASGRDREAGRRETETLDRGGRHGQQDRQVGQGEEGQHAKQGRGVLAIQLMGWAEGLADMVGQSVVKAELADGRMSGERIVEAEWAEGQHEWRAL